MIEDARCENSVKKIEYAQNTGPSLEVLTLIDGWTLGPISTCIHPRRRLGHFSLMQDQLWYLLVVFPWLLAPLSLLCALVVFAPCFYCGRRLRGCLWPKSCVCLLLDLLAMCSLLCPWLQLCFTFLFLVLCPCSCSLMFKFMSMFVFTTCGRLDLDTLSLVRSLLVLECQSHLSSFTGHSSMFILLL